MRLKVTIKTSIANKLNHSFPRFIFSLAAFSANLIVKSKIGIRSGRLKMARMPEPPLVLTDIPEIKVTHDDNPKTPKRNAHIKLMLQIEMADPIIIWKRKSVINPMTKTVIKL